MSRAHDQTPGRVATTIISVAELHYGAAKSRDRGRELEEIERFLASLDIVGLDVKAAKAFGDIKATLERQGQRLPDADLFIAAICLANNATLVTGNRRHFDRIPGLVTEDWIRESPG